MERLAAVLCVLIISLAIISAGGAEMMNPEQMPEMEELPELLRFADGGEVKTPEDWERRREELLALYSEYMYGYMPDRAREAVTWTAEAAPDLDGTLLTVTVEAEGRSTSFSVLAGIPAGEKPAGGFPFYMEYWPWHYQNWFTKEWVSGFSDNCRYAMSRGYAGIQYDCGQVAQDNQTFTGAFYTLYPYNRTEPAEQRGTLLAWAWGVSKVIDALESGAGEALGIDPGCALVSGVSRYGKSAAVAGAYDSRIRVTIPSCSGAGGIAVYRTDNHGKKYDLTGLGGPAEWTNDSVNEPFSNLQGGEGYWFCGNFRRFASVKQLPVDQHMLCALAAGPDRHLIVVTGITSEGWNNTEGQCLAWAASQPVWDLLGIGDRNNMIIHLDGHAVLRSDMEMILDYCDVHLRGISPDEIRSDLGRMKGNLFLEDNRDRLDRFFAPYLAE